MVNLKEDGFKYCDKTLGEIIRIVDIMGKLNSETIQHIVYDF